LYPLKSVEEHRFLNLVKQTTKLTITRKSFEELSIVMIKKGLNRIIKKTLKELENVRAGASS
jgi:hypothetical protein